MSEPSESVKHDPENYRRMREPRPMAEVEANVARFAAGLEVLRRECCVGELFYVLKLDTLYEGGEEGRVSVCGHFGSELEMEAMAAFGFAYAQGNRQKLIAQIIASQPAVRSPRHKD